MSKRGADLNDLELEMLFADRREAAPPLSDAFLERLTEDGLTEMAAQQAQVLRPKVAAGAPISAASWLRRMALRGLWPVGLAASMAVGVYLGGLAEYNGYLAASGVLESSLAQSIAYQMPELSGYLQGE